MQIENQIQINAAHRYCPFPGDASLKSKTGGKIFSAEVTASKILSHRSAPAELPFPSPGIFSSHVTILFLLRGRRIVRNAGISGRCG